MEKDADENEWGEASKDDIFDAIANNQFPLDAMILGINADLPDINDQPQGRTALHNDRDDDDVDKDAGDDDEKWGDEYTDEDEAPDMDENQDTDEDEASDMDENEDTDEDPDVDDNDEEEWEEASDDDDDVDEEPNNIFDAIDANNKRAVHAMILADPGVLTISKWDETPLFYAIHDKKFDMALHIINCGGEHLDIDAELPDDSGDHPKGYTALHMACFHTHLDLVKLLVDRGANPAHETKPGWMPLSDAMNKMGQANEVVEFLLKIPAVRAKLHVLEETGYSPLTLATCGSSIERVARNIKLLLDAGADPTYPSGCHYPLCQLKYDHRSAPPDTLAVPVASLQGAIDDCMRVRLLFKAYRLVNSPTASGTRIDVPSAATTVSPAEESENMDTKERRTEVLRFALGMRNDSNLPHELFTELMMMMVPRHDPSWRGEKLGGLLERIKDSEKSQKN